MHRRPGEHGHARALRRLPDAESLAAANPEDVEEIIRTTGFFRAKTRSLIGMAERVEDRFGGEVPTEIEDLVTVPGVGRKTANVVRSVAFDLPGLPVDTHVLRVSKRLASHRGPAGAGRKDPVKVEPRTERLDSRRPSGALSAFG